MQLKTTYSGSQFPFEGDRTLWLRSLPQYARIQTARLTVVPSLRQGETQPSFDEIVDLGTGQPPPERWGATIRNGTGFVEIDFGARRTLVSITGTGLSGATLQVELGGIYVPISNLGTVLSSGGTPLTLSASTPAVLPGLTVSKFKLMNAGTMAINRVAIRSTPSMISARIGKQPNFWVRTGELTYAADSPDFADLLNLALAETELKDGFFQLPVVVHSDTIARLDVTLDIEYVIEQPVLPPHLPEVVVPYNYSSLPGVQEGLLQVNLPRGATPVTGKTVAQVAGQFKDTRVAWSVGDIGELPDVTYAVKVSPQMALAQPVVTDREIQVIGIDLPMGRTTPGTSGLNIAFQEDHDGKPSGTQLATAALEVQKPLPDQTTWASATLNSPLRIEPYKRYWLVLQSEVNEADWTTASAPETSEPLQATVNNGFTWRVLNQPQAQGAINGLFRLRHKTEQFTIPVWLRLGKRPATLRRLDEFAPLGKIQFTFDFAEKLQEHLDVLDTDSGTDDTDDCGSDELLVNESFVYPPPEDATLRLFGMYTSRGTTEQQSVPRQRPGEGDTSITGTVDLRQGADLTVERFITLQLAVTLLEVTGPANDETRTERHRFTMQTRINCAGVRPNRTLIDEIVGRINGVVQQVALDTVKDVPAAAPFEALLKAMQVAQAETRSDNQENEVQTGRLVIRGGDVADAPMPPPTEEFSEAGRRVVTVEPHLVPWCDNVMPSGWRGTGRHLLRLRVPEPTGRLAVVLLPPALRTALADGRDSTFYSECLDMPGTQGAADTEGWLSQRVGVRDTCIYLFRMVYLVQAVRDRAASGTTVRPTVNSDAEAFWEITWTDAGRRVLRTDTEPIEQQTTTGRRADFFQVFERPLRPPTGAVAAEIRIVLPFDEPAMLAIERASFMPTSLRVRNSYFQDFDATTRTFGAWETQRGLVSVITQGGVTRPVLDGAGPDDAILVQRLPVNGGGDYEFRVSARVQSITGDAPDSRPVSKRARAELCWLANGQCLDTVTLILDDTGFSERIWAGTAPQGVTDADIRLIQPRGGGSLIVEFAELLAVQRTRVPLYFMAESPGELVVSNVNVAYNPPQPARPMLTPEKEEVQPILSSASAALRPLFEPGSNVEGEDDKEHCEDDEAEPAIPLTAVAGIGANRAQALNQAGISSLSKLADSDPQHVHSVLRQTGAFSEAMARRVVSDARRLLRTSGDPHE